MTKEQIQERLDFLNNASDITLEDDYCEYLDEVYEEVKIGCLTFQPSRIVRELDPIAFNIGFSDYISNQIYELEEQLKQLEDE